MAASNVTDIRLQLTFFGNRKVKLLKRQVGPEGVLSLIKLWCYCAANEPDGAMLGWTEDEVECAADWDGMRGAFVSHSLACGLLDPLKEGGFEIHDWSENQPWAAQSTERSARAKAAAVARWERQRSKLNDAESMRPACDMQTSSNAPFLSSPYPSLPSPSSPTKSKSARKRRATIKDCYRIQEAIDTYDQDRIKPDAALIRWWASNVEPGDDGKVDMLLSRIRVWADSDQFRQGMAWNIGKFFNQGHYMTEPKRKMGKQEQIEANNAAVLRHFLDEVDNG